MVESLLIMLVIINIIGVVLLLIILMRSSTAKLLKFEYRFNSLDKNLDSLGRDLREEISKNRDETNKNARQVREELNNSLKIFGDFFLTRMSEIATMQKNQLDIFSNQLLNLSQTNEQKLDKMRITIEERLKALQDDNSQKLEQMRVTVDEKLHITLEKRLGESFKLVSDRLELVYRGLGEMQSLASGVGDLKKVLMNVKTRGTWGEIQLGNLLEQVMTIEQYSKNVATKKGSSERVEFAIKLPGHDRMNENVVWLPIDAKFPQEDYQRLVDAVEQGNPSLAEEAAKKLEVRIKSEAKDIRDKYLDPPHTTDFAIMFLPTEGLYAEILRRPGLCDTLQKDYRIVLTGPTTLFALLNSLQMGFRTLAIEKRSSEVWMMLGAVKTEFHKFTDILVKTQKKLQEASNTIEDAARKSRTIQRKLKDVEELPTSEINGLNGGEISDIDNDIDGESA